MGDSLARNSIGNSNDVKSHNASFVGFGQDVSENRPFDIERQIKAGPLSKIDAYLDDFFLSSAPCYYCSFCLLYTRVLAISAPLRSWVSFRYDLFGKWVNDF